MRAQGSFEVTLTPHPDVDSQDGVSLGRTSLQKQFHGELSGTSSGSMLSAIGTQPGSAGYVAIERVTGTLHGKRGSFVLQHDGLMDRGQRQLVIHVVPDTGTSELTGLRGSMRIDIVDGKHFYDLEFEL